MNKKLENISFSAIGLLLALVLLFPSVLQLEHLTEGHDHKPCKDQTSHLHEKSLDCSIHLFSFPAFQLKFESYSTLKKPVVFETTNHQYVAHHFNNKKRFIALRGPPALLEY